MATTTKRAPAKTTAKKSDAKVPAKRNWEAGYDQATAGTKPRGNKTAAKGKRTLTQM